MGLRVYLDRPWYSSGDGERLGVVLWSDPTTAPNDAQRAYVSEWGLDPLHLTAAPSQGPKLAAFKLADATRTTDLTLAEVAGTTFHVAGHKVEYDASRKLWFADLEIDAGPTYMPFVRLALARFQPISLTTAHLSPVVRADFVQLAPDRAVTITRPRTASRDLAITVAGVGYTRTAGVDGRSVIEVGVERKRPNTDVSTAQELGWEAIASPAATLTPADGPNGTTVWTGQLTLPAGTAGAFRVIVREVELYGSARRPVYADAIVI
jgi:hypothetical protein